MNAYRDTGNFTSDRFGMELRLINWYRRERAIVDSKSEHVQPHWRRTSQDICNEIVKALGYAPETTPTDNGNTDSGTSSHKGVRSEQSGR